MVTPLPAPMHDCAAATAAAAALVALLLLPRPLLPGRFKDEGRHQQRLTDMRERCNALFDGTIQGHFVVRHCTLSRSEVCLTHSLLSESGRSTC